MSTEFDFDFDFEKELNEIAAEPKAPVYIEVPLDGELRTIMDSSSAYQPGVELSNLLSEYATVKDSMLPKLEEIKSISSEIEELRRSVTAQIRLLDEKRQDIEASLFDARRKQRELERQIQSAENRLRQALENERIKKEYQDNSIAFDKLTAGFRWREFALQHQIEGAKHLATAKRAILGDKMGLGKAIPNSEFVLTPYGYKPMGSIAPYDFVIGSNGKPTRVVGVYPQGERDIYKLTFNDGAVAYADGDHIWNVQTNNDITYGKSHNLTTLEIMEKGVRDTAKNLRYRIPVVKPVEFNVSEPLPMPAYTMGAMLGDGAMSGTNRSAVITGIDHEVMDWIEIDGFDLTQHTSNLQNFTVHGIVPALKQAGVWGFKSEHKFIPEVYFTAPVADRLALLQGLMDTDGGLQQGYAYFYTVSEELAAGVVKIVNSLGGICRVTRKKISAGGNFVPITVHVNLPAMFNPFRISRKADNYTPSTKYTPSRRIASIEFSHREEATCIKVTAEDSLFVMNNFVVTHNTLTSLIACDMLQAQKVLVIVPDDVVSNFVREIQHWAPHRSVIMLGKQTKLARNMAIDLMRSLDSFIVVINYSAWRKDNSLLDRLVSLRFDTVIMDEAHTIKETTTNAYKGCAQLVLAENSCPKCRGAIQKVHKSEDTISKLHEMNIYNSSRDYWACIGQSASSPTAVDDELAASIMSTGCGWNEIVELLAGNSREFGDLRSVRNVFPMTGTPILNKPTDLFSMLSLVDPLRYSNKNEFNRTYCIQDSAGKWMFQYGGLDRLVKNLSGKYIARDRKTAGVVLPKQDIVVHSIEMDSARYPGQAKVIKDLSRQAMIILQNGAKLPILYTIALITRKRQANVWPAGIELKDENGVVVFSVGDEVKESIKLDRICGKAESGLPGDYEGLIPDLTGNGDLTNGERIVVFSQFKTPLAELESRIKDAGISVVRFDGDTPEETRNQIKIDFDRKYCDQIGYEPRWQVVLANYKTGGVGLNFTAATQMIILDEEWNPGKAEQAFNRIDRIGQTEETTVHILRLEKSIDNWLADLIDSKRDMIEGFETKIDLQASLLKAMQEGEMD